MDERLCNLAVEAGARRVRIAPDIMTTVLGHIYYPLQGSVKRIAIPARTLMTIQPGYHIAQLYTG